LLTAGVASQNGSKGGAIPSAFSDPALSTSLTSFISSGRPYVTARPKAFLNWMVVGEDYTSAASSPNHVNAVQIPVCNAGDTLKQVVGPAGMVIRRNGWIYIYLSNESAQDVFFDNLVINLKHGPLVEQNDYYAFGMENPGLSTKALKYQYNQNRYKFNGIEYDSAFGINEFDAHYRNLDPAIGRWTTIDPQIEEGDLSISPYASMSNNPVFKTDPLGNLDGGCCGEVLNDVGSALKETFTSLYNGAVDVARTINTTVNFLTPVVEVVTGKSVESNLTEDKSRITAAVEGAMFLVPGGKAEGAAVKIIEENTTKVAEQATAKTIITASNGVEVKGIIPHAVNRAIERGVKPTAIKDALKNTLKTGKVVTDELGRKSQRFIGKSAEVVVNPETAKIISVNPTSTKKAAKLILQAGGN
ncbi:MAG: RHS repeat-associated core domain-containing protein, partial [Puia sp.]